MKYLEWLCSPCLLPGTLNVLQVPLSRRGSSWHPSNHSRMLKFGTKVSNQIWITIWGQGRPISTMSPVRNHNYPPSCWWLHGGSWHTSNHARKNKFGTPISKTIIRSWMTHVLHVFGQEPSVSSKSYIRRGVGVLDPLLIMLECSKSGNRSGIQYQ